MQGFLSSQHLAGTAVGLSVTAKITVVPNSLSPFSHSHIHLWRRLTSKDLCGISSHQGGPGGLLHPHCTFGGSLASWQTKQTHQERAWSRGTPIFTDTSTETFGQAGLQQTAAAGFAWHRQEFTACVLFPRFPYLALAAEPGSTTQQHQQQLLHHPAPPQQSLGDFSKKLQQWRNTLESTEESIFSSCKRAGNRRKPLKSWAYGERWKNYVK